MKKNVTFVQGRMKKMAVVLSLLVLGFSMMQAQQDWVSFTDGTMAADSVSKSSGRPKTQLISEKNGEIELEFSVPGMLKAELNQDGEVYQVLTVPGAGKTSEEGKPELPQYTQFVEIPAGCEADIYVEYVDSNELKGYTVYPVQMPVDLVGEEYTFAKDENAYSQVTYYPRNIAELGMPMMLRGHNLVPVIISPVQYNAFNRTLKVYSYIKVKVVYKTSAAELAPAGVNIVSREFENMVKSFAINYKAPELSQFEAAAENGADYLIITGDDFESAASRLAVHKEAMGLSTKVVTLSQIGVNPTADQISAFIQNAYNTWSPAPSYLLLMGDYEVVPAHLKTRHPYSGDLIPTDLYYATLDSVNTSGYPDYTPDIFVGRLPVETVIKADIVVDKIIAYENDTTEAAWKNNILLAAYFQDGNKDGRADRFFLQTSEEERVYLESSTRFNVETSYVHSYGTTPTSYYYGGPLQPDVKFLDSTGATNKIIDTINNGVSLIGHRDHGYYAGWGDPRFTTSHISKLTNEGKLFVMFSVNCESGKFDRLEGFCEQLVEKENGGAIAALGATRVSYSGYNDELSRGFYDAIWADFDGNYSNNLEGTKEVGKILNYGKMFMYKMRPGARYPWGTSESTFKIEFELFNLLGDPSLEIELNDSVQPNEWSIWTGEGGSGTVTENDGGFTARVTATGANPWSVHVYKEGINIENSKTYRVKFEARTDDARDIIVALGKALTSDPWWESFTEKRSFSLGTEFREYEFVFTMNSDTYDNSKLSFELGNVPGVQLPTFIYVKNVSITEEVIVNPDFGFWTGEGGAGSKTEKNGKITVNVTNTGIVPWAVQTYKEGYTFEKGKSYRISFNANASGFKRISVAVGEPLDNEPWFIQFTTKRVFELNAETQKCSYWFHMGNDSCENSKLSFEVGNVDGTNVPVTINISDIVVEEID